MVRNRHHIAPVALTLALAAPLAGCEPGIDGCWKLFFETGTYTLSVGWDFKFDGENYEANGTWSLNTGSGEQRGHMTGIALRDGRNYTISQELVDCEGNPAGTLQFEGERKDGKVVWGPDGPEYEPATLEGTITLVTGGETYVRANRKATQSVCLDFCD